MDYGDIFGTPSPAPKPPPSAAPAPATAPTAKAASTPPAGPAPRASGDWLAGYAASGASFKPLPKPPSALQAVGDVLDLPFAYADALVRGGKGYTNTAEVGKVTNELRTKGLRGLEDVSERYGLFAPEQLQDEAAHGDSVAGFFAKHPKAAAAADFVAEFANPSNLAVPLPLRAAAKGVGVAGRAARAIPAVDAAARGLEESFAPYAGVRRAGGFRGEQAARRYQQAASVGGVVAQERLEPIFKNTTRADAIEIERRSENLGKQGVVNPPKRTPAMSMDDAEIDKRAAAYRANLQRLDAEQLRHGIATPKQLFEHHEYTPRYGAFDKVYKDSSPMTDEVRDFYEEAKGPGGSIHRYGGSTLGKRKTKYTFDDAEAAGLSPEYDPRRNAILHFGDRLSKIERMKSRQELIDAGLLKEGVLQTQNKGKPLQTVFGTGRAGQEALSRYAGIVGRKMAGKQALANLQAQGFNIPTRPRLTNIGALEAKAKAAQQAAKYAGLQTQRLGATANVVNARAAATLGRRTDRLAARAQAILADANASAQARADATRDLQAAMQAKTRETLKERLGTGLPGGTAEGYASILGTQKTLKNLAEGSPGRRRFVARAQPVTRLSPQARTVYAVDALGNKVRDVAARGAEATQKAGALGQQRLTDAAAAQRAGTPRDAAAITAPVDQAITQATRGEAKAQTRVRKAIANYAYGHISNKQYAMYQAEVRRLFPGIKKNIISKIQQQAVDELQQSGYVVNTKSERVMQDMFGPSGTFVGGKPEAVKYLMDQGASHPQAQGFSAFIDTVNKLTRLGIISNPAVHVIWNLNTQFLGAGGRPEELAEVFNPRSSMFTKQAVDRARKYGAVADFAVSPNGLFGTEYGKIVGAGSDLTNLEKLDKVSTDIYNKNQALVFHTMETRFATALFRTLSRNAKSEEDLYRAGITVRKALGDYGNVSRTGIENTLNKAFFFYPWLKTVAPFWIAQLTTHPQRLNAPLEATRTNNELAGDPNVASEKPFTIDYAHRTTGDSYFATPLPIKYANDVLQVFAPKGDVLGGMTERAGEILNVAGTHASPPIAATMDVANTYYSPPQEPGGANYHTLFNKEAPSVEQLRQFGTAVVDRYLPFPLQVRQIAEYIDQLGSKDTPVQDAVAGSIAGVVGGTTYNRSSKQKERRLRSIQGAMSRVVQRLRSMGRDQEADDLYYKYKAQMDRVQKGQ